MRGRLPTMATLCSSFYVTRHAMYGVTSSLTWVCAIRELSFNTVVLLMS